MHYNKLEFFQHFFYLRLLKNVNKTPKFLQFYSTVDQNKEINLLISTVSTTVETSVKKKKKKFLSTGLINVEDRLHLLSTVVSVGN